MNYKNLLGTQKKFKTTFLSLFFSLSTFPQITVLVGMFFICCCIFLPSSKSLAQTTITLEEAEESFLKNNLLLLAEQYNIDMTKAQVIQAKIWELPYISAELNAINPQNRKIADVGRNGEKIVAIQQLIYLGGKKKNEVEFAKSNVEIAQLQFEQLLRNLRFELHQNFYILYFEEQKIKTIKSQISNLDTLISAYSNQVEKGNIPLKDLTRLHSFSFSLQNDLLEIQKNSHQSQQIISLLTGFSQPILASGIETKVQRFYDKTVLFSRDSLLSLSLSQNPEYLTYQKIIQSDYLRWQWQKSLAVPDLNLGAGYDQLGGAFKNQVNLTLGIPLPLWNRNKGNIQTAQIQIEQFKKQQDFKREEIRTLLETAYLNWQMQYKQYKSIQTTTSQNLNTVYQGVLQNFQKGNISLLEFTDFMESYNNNSLILNEIKKQLVLTGEQLNYITNQDLF
jgi:cobalt-zinc-cadmium efflux system outer membrane protein